MQKLLIPNSSNAISRSLNADIKEAYQNATEFCREHFNLDSDSYDCIILTDKNSTDFDIGVGGFTPNQHTALIYIDPKNEHFDTKEVFYAMCHEFCHIARYPHGSYGTTLLDSMIFEGIAVYTESIASNDASHVCKQMDDAIASRLLHEYEDELASSAFDYNNWFTLDPSGKLPKWAGYQVGYYLVTLYANHAGTSLSKLMRSSSAEIYAFYKAHK